jgi:hypothetical protein
VVKVLAPVRCAQGVEGAVRVARPEALDRQARYSGVGLLGDAECEPSGLERRNRVDQRARGVVDPIHVLRLGVGERERYATLQFVGERQHPGIPKRDVAEHGGDRPVLVYGSANLVLDLALDQGAKALALSRVLIQVRAILGHAFMTIPLAPAGYPIPPSQRAAGCECPRGLEPRTCGLRVSVGECAKLHPDLEKLHGTGYMDALIEETGAVLMGRRTFEMAEDPDWYVGNYEFQVPIFVLTHDLPEVAPNRTSV